VCVSWFLGLSGRVSCVELDMEDSEEVVELTKGPSGSVLPLLPSAKFAEGEFSYKICVVSTPRRPEPNEKGSSPGENFLCAFLHISAQKCFCIYFLKNLKTLVLGAVNQEKIPSFLDVVKKWDIGRKSIQMVCICF